ncbi:MAG: hypothetical protein DHS20C01_34890 [marine bacterium B5-7]|nr:MAG: hypothetical protein DHS20C01_34890 [marine bacterium B5-7]
MKKRYFNNGTLLKHALLLAMAISISFGGVAAFGSEILFYNVNKKGQQSLLGMLPNRDEPGCHNMFFSKDVFRVAQIGFTYCSVYAEKDCPEDAAMIMRWKGRVKKNSARAQPTDRLMPGDMWYFEDNAERKVGSWHCEP